MSFAMIVGFIVWCIIFGIMCAIGLMSENNDPVAPVWTRPPSNKFATSTTRHPNTEQIQLLLINLAVEETIRAVN